MPNVCISHCKHVRTIELVSNFITRDCFLFLPWCLSTNDLLSELSYEHYDLCGWEVNKNVVLRCSPLILWHLSFVLFWYELSKVGWCVP